MLTKGMPDNLAAMPIWVTHSSSKLAQMAFKRRCVSDGGDGEGNVHEANMAAVRRTPGPPPADFAPSSMKATPAAIIAPAIASIEFAATGLPPSKRRTVATPIFALSAKSWADHPRSALAHRHCSTFTI